MGACILLIRQGPVPLSVLGIVVHLEVIRPVLFAIESTCRIGVSCLCERIRRLKGQRDQLAVEVDVHDGGVVGLDASVGLGVRHGPVRVRLEAGERHARRGHLGPVGQRGRAEDVEAGHAALQRVRAGERPEHRLCDALVGADSFAGVVRHVVVRLVPGGGVLVVRHLLLPDDDSVGGVRLGNPLGVEGHVRVERDPAVRVRGGDRLAEVVREAGEVRGHDAVGVGYLLAVRDVRHLVVSVVGAGPPAAELVAGARGDLDGADVGVGLHEERADVRGAGALRERRAEAEEVRLHVHGPHRDHMAAVLRGPVHLEERVVHLQERLLRDALRGIGHDLRLGAAGGAVVLPAAEVLATAIAERRRHVADADLHRVRLVVERHEAAAHDVHVFDVLHVLLGRLVELHEAGVLVERHHPVVGVARLGLGERYRVREREALARHANGPDEDERDGRGVQLGLGHVQAVHGGVRVRLHHVPALERAHEVAIHVHDVRRDGRFDEAVAVLDYLDVDHLV